jgi:hypothetical protein
MYKGKLIAVIAFVAIFSILFCSALSGAEQLSVQSMHTSISRMEENLRSPFAKAGLEMTIWDFYRARVALSPNKYEAREDFQKGFRESFAIFQKRLTAGNFQQIQYKIKEDDLKSFEKSFEKNRVKYLEFMKSMAVTEYFPPYYPVNFITESQLYYSLLLFDVGKDLLTKARKLTYIYPFCDD